MLVFGCEGFIAALGSAEVRSNAVHWMQDVFRQAEPELSSVR